ncbi:hypothetical protein ACX6XY_07725 [Streptomyces sp. O3]
MSWDEWERLKADAAAGQLRHSGKPWADAATAARELRASIATGRGDLRQAHGGVTAGTHGLASARALAGVLASWEKRLESVRDECGALAPRLRQAAKDQRETDARVKAGVDAVRVPEASRGR